MPVLDNAHALVVGIADYQHISKLPPVQDAQSIAGLLTDPSYCGYASHNVQLLLDEHATQAAVRAALAELAARCDQDSTVFIYVSGHGGRIESGPFMGEYLLPVDTVYPSEESLARSAISGAELTEALRAIAARKVVVVFDCCHAGGIGQPKDVAAPVLKAGLPERYYDVLKAGRGRVIVASSRDDEYSYVLEGADYGVFTRHLLDGLRGGVPGPGGVIRIFDLFHYLQPKVTADSPDQHPIFKAEIEENFAVALYLGGVAAPLPTPAPGDGFRYDVFISYRQQEPDKTWVRKRLLPALAASGLRVCVDYRDFRLGAPLVLEMERAVEQSCYTLAVLSPAYLTSNFTELETVLAEHLGLEQSQRRLLAAMREPCRPRLGMRARLWLDMSEDEEFETDIARLVYELRQPPDA